jgi:hypothetical protein
MVQLLFALLVVCMMVGCAASVFIGSVIVLALFALLLCFLYFVLGPWGCALLVAAFVAVGVAVAASPTLREWQRQWGPE